MLLNDELGKSENNESLTCTCQNGFVRNSLDFCVECDYVLSQSLCEDITCSSAGYFWDNDKMQCLLCPIGQYWSTELNTCKSCLENISAQNISSCPRACLNFPASYRQRPLIDNPTRICECNLVNDDGKCLDQSGGCNSSDIMQNTCESAACPG